MSAKPEEKMDVAPRGRGQGRRGPLSQRKQRCRRRRVLCQGVRRRRRRSAIRPTRRGGTCTSTSTSTAARSCSRIRSPITAIRTRSRRGYTLHMKVDDVDFWWKRAVDAGAEVVLPLQRMFWGDRYGQLRDPFGVLWSMGQPDTSA